MNIFSNIGITELVIILLLALIVVGPERLPELARQLGKTLRDLRKAYDNLTQEIGPELASIQEATREIKESVDSVRTIPQDAVKSALKAADLEGTVEELKDVKDTFGQVGKTLSSTQKVIRDPVSAAVGAARATLDPKAKEPEQAPKETGDAVEAALPPPPEAVPQVDDTTADDEALSSAIRAARATLAVPADTGQAIEEEARQSTPDGPDAEIEDGQGDGSTEEWDLNPVEQDHE